MQKKYLNKFELRGKKAFILGGCGLLGRKIVEVFLEAQAEVFIIDQNKILGKSLEKKYGGKNVKFINYKISNLFKADKEFKKIIKHNGCPDIFINCTYPKTKDWNKSSFKSNKLKNLKENVDLHLNSHTWLSSQICKEMRKRKIRGSVVIFGSIYGLMGQKPNIYKGTNMSENMNYSIIKGGLINFSKQLASYYGKFNIRVNAICPGGIKDSQGKISKKQFKLFSKKYANNCPLNRLGLPEEVATSVLFLASDASSYITGTSFMVDGGWSAV